MGWTNEQLDEVFAPGSVPFKPGFDVIGIGSQLPPELTAAGITSALVFYNHIWNPASTNAQPKFFFVANTGAPTQAGYPSQQIVVGYGLVTNATVSQVATIHTIWQFAEVGFGTLVGNVARFYNRNNTNVINLGENANGAGAVTLFDENSNLTLQVDADLELISIPSTDPLGYGQWQSCSLVNGWSAAPSPSFNRWSGVWVRRMPDGTVYMRGTATPGTTTAGTYICQLPSSAYYPGAGLIVVAYSLTVTPRFVIDSGNGAMTLLNGPTPSSELDFTASWSVL